MLDLDSHIFNYEVAGAAVIGSVQMRPVKTARGFLARTRSARRCVPRTSTCRRPGWCASRTPHNRHGGTCCTPEEISAIAAVAHGASVPVHLDGARLFNAAVALKRPARDFAARRRLRHVLRLEGPRRARSARSICGSGDRSSRGPGACRKMLGGGMRQAGVIAAAGIVALERMVGSARRGSRQRARAGRAARPASRARRRPGERADEHRDLRGRARRSPASAVATAELVAGCAARKVKIHAIGPSLDPVRDPQRHRRGGHRAARSMPSPKSHASGSSRGRHGRTTARGQGAEDALLHRRGRRPRRRRDRFLHQQGRDARHRRRVGLRQERHGARRSCA